MMITFKSRAASDVLFFENAAKEFLRCIGKDMTAATGIITVEQLPAAIDSVRKAIATDKTEARPAGDKAGDEGTDEGATDAADEHVSLSQRAQPMLELLERSRAEGVPVVWGV
ncbi:DUF1840 domain-containing protein [Thauera sp.]|jgi:hypothetical protein|uniref:DUF1840 domain-containing protein n=1 Tax=Thauera sp. TaxID=1905334 RepID=UPI0026388BA6|nr:DUF1840 domain-containing protein [Thauera sp.]MCK6410578.1 DUF1840 domain-containing protein [Thauera sp.]